MEEATFSGTEPINGTDVYYEYYKHESSRETLVLLHGFLSSTFSFRRLIPLLKTEFNVVSVDLPPFGKSGKSSQFVYSYENLAKTVIQLSEKLSFEKVTLVGHSMGGQIVLNVAHSKPELVDQAVLLCSSGYMKKMKPHLIFSSYIPFFYLYVKLYLQRSGVKQNLKNVVHDHSMIDDEMLYGYLSPFLEDDIFRALTRMIRDREGDLPPAALKRIETPCLLIWGEHDRVVPLHIGKRLNNDLKNSKLVVLKDTGHLVPEERPEDVLQHIKRFMKTAESV
ncbi:alpha/beta hydrolase [Aeromicrobium ponti]|uniref:Pimeloyl-ACP methyl ester carboxylesterase n=1 Tax=Cytobacillus oceanisediminis TaxID=665099 RepID=A0A562K3Q2_9BACI|nr:alpha/beta hydrolase [Cytobacillus oceanisediminis]TWH90052.1 pimeloyl-ACP methyl ester carboxylesterase [Cytobacillus oceanisediminis]